MTCEIATLKKLAELEKQVLDLQERIDKLTEVYNRHAHGTPMFSHSITYAPLERVGEDNYYRGRTGPK